MNIQLEFLSKSLRSQRLLRQAGWVLIARPGARANCFAASHGAVLNENDARHNFARLGLLTSPTLRIEFQAGGCEQQENRL